MRGALRHIDLIKARFGVRVLPDRQVAGIVASGTIHFGVSRMIIRTKTLRGIVAIRALYRRVMRAVAACALPAFVRRGGGLFVDHIKTVRADVAFLTQLRAGGHRFVGPRVLVPEREGGRVRIAYLLMADIARDTCPLRLRHRHTPGELWAWLARLAFAARAIVCGFSGGSMGIPIPG